MHHDSPPAPLVPSVPERTIESKPTRAGLAALRDRALSLAIATRAVAGGRRPWLEEALRDAVRRANQAANAAANRTQPHIRRAARVAARRLDPAVGMSERYAEGLKELVDAIGEDVGGGASPATSAVRALAGGHAS